MLMFILLVLLSAGVALTVSSPRRADGLPRTGSFPQLVRQQSEHSERILPSYVELSVADGGHRKLYGGACGARPTLRTAEEQVRDIGSVVGIQDCRAVRLPRGEIQNPDDAVGRAAGGDHGRRAAKREHVSRFRKLWSRNASIRNQELAQRIVNPGNIDVSIPVS